MQYKTIVLELLQQNPQVYDALRRQHMLLPALEFYAKGLKHHHEMKKVILAQARPGSDPSQIASEALEIALKELEDTLSAASPNLEEAIAYIRDHTPPA